MAELDTVGLWVVDEKELGPDQLYEVIPAAPPVKVKLEPVHTGELELADAVGKALTVALTVAERAQPVAVIVPVTV